MNTLINVVILCSGMFIGWCIGLCTDIVITSFKAHKTERLLKEMRNDKSDEI